MVNGTEAEDVECIPVLDTAQLRQGDVFCWEAWKRDTYGRYGIVITADCDLLQGKPGYLDDMHRLVT